MSIALLPKWLALTLTSDLQNLNRSSVEAGEYSLKVLLRLLKPFMRYRGDKICRSNGQIND